MSKRQPPPQRRVLKSEVRGMNRLLTLDCGHTRLVGFKSKGPIVYCPSCPS